MTLSRLSEEEVIQGRTQRGQYRKWDSQTSATLYVCSKL